MTKPVITIQSLHWETFENRSNELAEAGYKLVAVDCAAHGNDEITDTYWLAVFALPELVAGMLDPVCICMPEPGHPDRLEVTRTNPGCPVHGDRHK